MIKNFIIFSLVFLFSVSNISAEDNLKTRNGNISTEDNDYKKQKNKNISTEDNNLKTKNEIIKVPVWKPLLLKIFLPIFPIPDFIWSKRKYLRIVKAVLYVVFYITAGIFYYILIPSPLPKIVISLMVILSFFVNVVWYIVDVIGILFKCKFVFGKKVELVY